MAINKSNIFPEEVQELAALAKALGHPARIAILQALAQKQSCICGEIVEILPLSQATVSQHLKALKEAGLIKGEVEGVKSCYCLNLEYLKRMSPLLNQFFKNILSPGCC
ncbi:MAG: ArsR/SmtB family transcription factor [Lewinella sp.]|uniref:ArsR/SmtB family transcription factor n=1 Tax=Lewinella sp. TaxID=2004506 RepID=UPI003D6B165A